MSEVKVLETYKPQPKQILYHEASQRNKLYGGAMGGGKTRTICEEIDRQMRRYKGNRGLICRKLFSDFKLSTYVILVEQVLNKYIEVGIVKENKNEKCFIYWNKSRLDYGGIQVGEGTSQKERDKYFSAEYGCIAIDETREVTEDTFKKLGTRLRHRLPKDAPEYGTVDEYGEKRPPYHMLLASNPSQNWLKTRFILACNPELDIFIPALPKENRYNPPDYEKQLIDLFRNDMKMLKAYVEGSWDSIGSINDLLLMDEILPCTNFKYVNDSKFKREFTVCDPARFGDDTTVVYDFKDVEPVDSEFYGKKDTMETVGRLMFHQSQNKSSLIGLDTIGEGVGIYDRLLEIVRGIENCKWKPYSIDFRESSGDPSFFNLRAEVYWNASLMIKNRQVPVPKDPQLHGQLCSIKYKFVGSAKGTRVQIESKDEIKKRLGVSPDKADAYAMGLWLYGICPVKKKENKWMDGYRSENRRKVSHMAA